MAVLTVPAHSLPRKQESDGHCSLCQHQHTSWHWYVDHVGLITLIGAEQSRRDDLESLGYVLMYFNRGSLPWQGLKAVTKRQKYDKISEKKMSTPVEVLCNGYPSLYRVQILLLMCAVEFATYLNYCRSLRFEDKPDYSYLRQIFRNLFHREGYTYDYIFDWTLQIQVGSCLCSPSSFSKEQRKTSDGGAITVPSASGQPVQVAPPVGMDTSVPSVQPTGRPGFGGGYDDTDDRGSVTQHHSHQLILNSGEPTGGVSSPTAPQ
jgi:hypothetical protein